MKDFVVKKSISIHAPAEVVWDALTNPEKTKKYFFNCKVFSDWKVGSPIVFQGRMFLLIPVKLEGVITEVKPNKLLRYKLFSDVDDRGGSSTVTDELEYLNGQTVLHITDDVGVGEGAEGRYERSVKGWDKILNGLKDLVEHN
ncbi:SRPBCC family protein [Mucilaginibacter ginsenosidivorans]|uniref:Activator of Hsp90 ATPase homologue 1/2-like C-terminal domain-containing protein n=1 Tax=Mucilaginibacter ginsenosidivorans TaxID=398053 RepID=A0A5B8UZF1_9SPHI|nr:SRPBCC family protein [Mucilaginibacter ginsenosidivorans]QEC64135.1 hypothetical protein FRZ54_16640 [Mucilaginibacter ginsenosidivorans]